MSIALYILSLIALAAIGWWVFRQIAGSPKVDRLLEDPEKQTPAKVATAKSALNAVETAADKDTKEAARLAEQAKEGHDLLVDTNQRPADEAPDGEEIEKTDE
jgi:hypothetical protein